MIKLFKHFKPLDYILMFLSIGLIVGQVYLDLKLPEYMSTITGLLKVGGQTDEILKNGGLMLACAIASGALAVLTGFISAKIGAGLAERLRCSLYDKISTFSPTEMHKFSVASLITRSTNDISQIQQSVSMGLQVMIKAPVMAIWAICKIVSKSWQWSLATAIAVVVMLMGISIIMALCLPKFKKVQKQTDDINRIARENLNGLRVVKAYNAENFEENKFEDVNTNLTKTHLFTGYSLSFMNPLMQLVMNGLSISIYMIGAYLINKASLLDRIELFKDMVTFFSYAMQIIAGFMMLIMIFMILPRAQVSFNRIQEVLDTETTIKDGKGVNPTQVGTVKFDNVSFCYSDAKEPVIQDVNFEISKGEKVAIIGATGSGKSTIIKLLPRLYDATQGTVFVDGENVKDYKLSALYDKIGYISQKATLFSGTVESNIAMGEKENKKISEDDVKRAVFESQSQTFVENMNGTYKAEIFQNGTNISGGQKQRLSIARALARKPEILIFDDSFSALDYQTDKNLRKVLETDLKDTTCIIVAQRIGTIKNCDNIIVVDNGKIVGMGKHDELLRTCSVYKDIALSQLSKEELENGTTK